MTIEKKVEDMSPLEQLEEIHKREKEKISMYYKGKNSCPECSGYLIYIERFKIIKCYQCGYKPK